MEHDVLCENCKRPYKEEERIFKKKFYKKIGKENWCDDCIAENHIE